MWTKIKQGINYTRAVFRKHGLIRIAKMAGSLLREHGLKGTWDIVHFKLSAVSPLLRGKHKLPDVGFRLHAHKTPVDIIVCVHNAPEDVTRCLQSVLEHTLPPYSLILVDDGSDEETQEYLKAFADSQGARLIRHEQAKGYTCAANAGLRVSEAPWAILLNSDTIVTPYWIDRMMVCALSQANIGLVGPLSNTASWQSIPRVDDGDGDWADNVLPEGITPAQMALLLADASPRRYPKVGFLNGFCYMVRKDMRDEIGLFDEETFGAGYGEENDYCLRAHKAGWELAVADDVYVYHAQSKSYSHERRKQLCERADKALHEKHGELIAQRLAVTQQHPGLLAVRARADHLATRRALMDATRTRYEGKRIAFLLHAVEPGGGGNIIFRVAQALAEMGVIVEIINLATNQPGFEKNYPHPPVPIRYIEFAEELRHLAPRYDAIIATLFTTVEWLANYVEGIDYQPTLGYYVQDYEPYFFPHDDGLARQAKEGYTKIDGMVLMTKSQWNADELKTHTGAQAHVLRPAYAWDQCFPTIFKSAAHEAVNLCAMIRPSTPRRAPELTLSILKRLKETYGERINITIFGVKPDDNTFKAMDSDFVHRNAGELPVGDVPDLLDTQDIFLDLSTYQAMGLTALEAMASMVAVIAPQAGGADEFIEHDTSGLLIDTSDEEACFTAATRLIEEYDLRSRLQRNALYRANQFYPEQSAANMLIALFDQAVEKPLEEVA